MSSATALLRRRPLLTAASAFALAQLSPRGAASTGAQAATPRYRVLAFSRTTGFRHDSIPDAIAAVQALGAENGFLVDASEDPNIFTDSDLSGYTAVIFLLTTGHEPLFGWGTIWQLIVMSLGGAIATPIFFEFFNFVNRVLGPRTYSETSFRPDREIRRGR